MLDKVFRPCESMVIERVGSPRIDCVENFRIFVVFLNISAVAWFVESRRISSSFSRVLKIKICQRQGPEVPNIILGQLPFGSARPTLDEYRLGAGSMDSWIKVSVYLQDNITAFMSLFAGDSTEIFK